MTLELDHIIPIPLKDRFLQRRSDIWNNTIKLEQGDFIKIKAPSGTGKTTLVHILYQLRHDYEGTVRMDDVSVVDIKNDILAELRQQRMSIIFQDLRLFPNLTARENIELKRVMQKPFYEADMISSMAETLGISHIMGQRAGLCSYGEQQRIAIIRALMQPFSWLIMDEPFSHLDTVNTQKASSLIETECRKRNAGLIITDLDEDANFIYSKKYTL